MAAQPKNIKLLIPIQLLEYCIREDCIKALQILLYCKSFSSGKLRLNAECFHLLQATLRIKDRRTALKYLNHCVKLNWIGHDHTSNICFIRSFESICYQHGWTKRSSAVFDVTNLVHLKHFAYGAIISKNIYAKKFRWEVATPRKLNAAPKKRTVQSSIGDRTSTKPVYYGLSLSCLAELFGCSPTKACSEKKKTAKAGFIKVKKRYKTILVLSGPDFHVLNQFQSWKPEVRKKLKIWKGKKGYELVEQLYDEILPKIKLKNRQSAIFGKKDLLRKELREVVQIGEYIKS